YVATSYLFGSTTLHETPLGVSMSTDGGTSWAMLNAMPETTVVELLPLAGEPAGVYALTKTSRTPLALGNTTAIENAAALAQAETASAAAPTAEAATSMRTIVAWVIAGLAALALSFALATDLGRRRQRTATGSAEPVIEPGYVKHS
ncbi:MAG: hypothetical protein KDD83_08825, partial [Caldilineaceae bacterium]|nr:hypothetical protein [Caldilineaceae bacterium]